MAGHSKWANIKHRKGKADAKKGKIFSRITKEIITAVRHGGKDPKSNGRLRMVLLKARAANMPNDNIERNIKKAEGADQADFDEVTYELYGHGGVGIIAEALTDNKNRTASDLRIATNKRGGSIAMPGAVSYQFDKKGIIQVEKEGKNSDDLFLLSTEVGAEDFEEGQECFVVVTLPEKLYEVKELLEKEGYKCLEADIEMVPKNMITCDKETYDKNIALIEWLEGIDDIDTVYHNMVMEEE